MNVPPRPAVTAMRADEIDAVIALAHRIWHRHYPGIITPAQIDYMLAQRYRADVLAGDLAGTDVAWDVVRVDGELAGFASTHWLAASRELKLDKLYVHPDRQRQGLGQALLAAARARAAQLGAVAMILAVNKHNAGAIAAYTRAGFCVRDAVVAEIGGGFVMDDFIMALPLSTSPQATARA